MNDERVKLDYEEAKPPERPDRPPDGYMGYRAELTEEELRARPGWKTLMGGILFVVVVVFALLWLAGRVLRSHGI